MWSVFLKLLYASPEIRYASLDFKAYLDSLLVNILVALLVFFAFVLFMYILFTGIQYVTLFWIQLKKSKLEKKETYGEHTVENFAE